MKKTLLITLGTLTIIIVVSVWIYLFMFGTPKSANDVFTNFGLGGEPTPEFSSEAPSIVDTAPVTQTGASQALRQLTTRPVAGATFIEGGIRYVERGTGHIYDIMFSTGTESLVVGNTIPRSVDAIFREGGEQVAITYEIDGTEQIVVGTLSINSNGERVLDVINLPIGATGIAFGTTPLISYLEKNAGGTTGIYYNTFSGTSTIAFTIPLRDIEVLWGPSVYVYTTPSVHQYGYLYKVGKGSQLQYVTEPGLGLMALPLTDGVLTASFEEGGLVTKTISGTSTHTLSLSLFPEKCVQNPMAEELLYCGALGSLLTGELPDSWYKGVTTFADELWLIDVANMTSRALTNIMGESGRSVDISHIGTNASGTYIYFINKNDGTLWMFDTTVPGAQVGD